MISSVEVRRFADLWNYPASLWPHFNFIIFEAGVWLLCLMACTRKFYWLSFGKEILIDLSTGSTGLGT